MLADIEGLGQVIDTSGLSANKLRAWIKDLVGTDHSPLTLQFESFGYKNGVPPTPTMCSTCAVCPTRTGNTRCAR